MYRIYTPYGWIVTRSVEVIVTNLKQCFPGIILTVVKE